MKRKKFPKSLQIMSATFTLSEMSEVITTKLLTFLFPNNVRKHYITLLMSLTLIRKQSEGSL